MLFEVVLGIDNVVFLTILTGKLPEEKQRGAQLFGLALAMLFLAINKQLDLQSWLTMTLKEHALVHGWYQDRRSYQSLFIGGLGVFGLLLMGVLFWSVRERWRDFLIAGFGFGFLLVFVMARATSFHQIDAMINTSIVGFSLNGLFELTGIFLVGYGARHRTDDLAE